MATPGLLELRAKVRLFVVTPESVSVSVPSPLPPIVRLGGDRVTPKPTVTCEVAGARPFADAVIPTMPRAMPLMTGCRVGCVSPALKVTPGSDTAATVGSVLVS